MMGVGQLLSEDGVSFGGDDNVLGLDGAMVYIYNTKNSIKHN